jgi:hypothetical protein
LHLYPQFTPPEVYIGHLFFTFIFVATTPQPFTNNITCQKNPAFKVLGVLVTKLHTEALFYLVILGLILRQELHGRARISPTKTIDLNS